MSVAAISNHEERETLPMGEVNHEAHEDHEIRMSFFVIFVAFVVHTSVTSAG
jgi:hypothetical protein